MFSGTTNKHKRDKEIKIKYKVIFFFNEPQVRNTDKYMYVYICRDTHYVKHTIHNRDHVN